jgi:hypothetical protein
MVGGQGREGGAKNDHFGFAYVNGHTHELNEFMKKVNKGLEIIHTVCNEGKIVSIEKKGARGFPLGTAGLNIFF